VECWYYFPWKNKFYAVNTKYRKNTKQFDGGKQNTTTKKNFMSVGAIFILLFLTG